MVTGFSIGITQNSQSAAENQSNVTVALTVTWNGGSYNATGSAAGVLTVDGTDYDFTAVFNESQKISGSQVIYSKTLNILHDDDGSKTLVCSASFATGTAVGTVSACASCQLTGIPRESTVGATDANIGATSVISVSRKNAGYTHSVAWSFGQLSGYLADDSGTVSDSEVKLTATGLSFPIPEEFYERIPDARWDDCKLTVRTYLGDTRIGGEKSCSFRVTAAQTDCVPEVSGTVTDINEKTVALTGDAGVLVRGQSTALCVISARAKNGASLAGCYIDRVQIQEDTRRIEGIESGSVRFSAVDSRGYTAAFTKEAALIEYVALTCNGEAARTDPTEGTAVVKVTGNYFDSSFGTQDNSLQILCRTEDGETVTLAPEIADGKYSATALLSGLDYRQSHTLTVTVTDRLMTVTKLLTVGKGVPLFDWGEEDFAFHIPVSCPRGVNGVYMGSRYVADVNSMKLQTEVSAFDGTAKGRQTFFITGCANGLPVHGLAGVWLKDGETFLSGTGLASAAADTATGQVAVAFDTTPWDTFAVLSNKPFQFIDEEE